MRIAYLTNQYPKVSHTFIRREIDGMEALGVHVERFTLRPAGPDVVDPVERAEIAHTHVLVDRGAVGLLLNLVIGAVTSPVRFARAFLRAVGLGWRANRGVLMHMAYLAEAVKLARMTRRLRIDHLHAHFGTNPPVCAMLSEIMGGPRWSMTIHGPEEFDQPRAMKLGDKIAAARFTVAISEYGRSQLYRWCDSKHWERIHVVRCGVDDAFLRHDAVPVPATPRFVCVGRLCEQKGHGVLVRAAAKLAQAGKDFEIVLCGDGELRAEIEDQARLLGVTDRFRITGWVGGAEIREELLAARAMVLPSFAEGLPVVIMEALAVGRPVVSTYVAGIPELVEPGESGWLVPAGDVDALAAAMGEVLDAPPSRLTQMGECGRNAVAARHDARTEAARLHAHFAAELGEK